MEFSDLALAKFLQTAPELGNLIITFKDLTSDMSEETDTSVGIFVLRSGEDFFFVPVISKANNIFPIDSIFFNSKEKFFPLTKKTVEQVLNSQKLSPGKRTKIPDSVIINPSVYDLITPPRTGKFAYASTSRLTDFLTQLPNDLKDFVREKVAEDKDVYTGLNNLFGLPEIFDALKPITQIKQAEVAAVEVATDGVNLTPNQINSITNDGYYIKQASTYDSDYSPRIAIKVQDFDKMGKMYQVNNLGYNLDHNIIFKTGVSRWGWTPRMQPKKELYRVSHTGGLDHGANQGGHPLVVFDNGDYCLGGNIIAKGEPKQDKSVVRSLLDFTPPIMLKNLESYDTFLALSPDLEVIGIYRVSGTPVIHEYGISLKVVDLVNNESMLLDGYRNLETVLVRNGKDMIVRYTTPVIRLRNNLTHDLEENLNSAATKTNIGEMLTLGGGMTIIHDGVEFHLNGHLVGPEIKMAQVLIDEGIDPQIIPSFIKEAKAKKKLRIYLSKKAAFEPGQIPQFGQKPPKQIENFGPGTSKFLPNVKDSLQSGDAQTVESTIISELLQSPDLNTYISEYLPDIEEAIDKLGRILFLSRVHINVLSEKNDPDGIFGFLATLKNVYRTLGDTYIKLQQLTTNVQPTSAQ